MDQDAIERQVMQLFMKAGDRMMREALGLDPEPPSPPDRTSQNVLTLTRMYWDLLALGRTYVEVVHDGKEVYIFYVPQDDAVYSVPKQDLTPPSVDYVFEWPSGGHKAEEENLHLNDEMISASVAYKQAGDPSWPNQPDPDEASSTSSTKTEPPKGNRALRRHPRALPDVPSPWRKPRWTRS